ncbi:MAG TPA: anthranilate phosphoribosyltransferase [Acidimicrobiales bacterium]|nr:anthranilate phosphoribosyltransferase [Acidimicrobiales bacterium]
MGGTDVAGLTWSDVLARLSRRESLSAEEAEEMLGVVLAGDATPVQVGAFLVLLHAKGETADEVTGLARAMVDAAVPCPLGEGSDVDDGRDVVVDLVGTGGDRLASINVTTLASFITAGAGVRVCKHGNRAASSSVGTADVLEALGVAIEVGPAGVAHCVAEAGMGFCFAQRFHPAMRFVGPVRKELGVRTVFNFLGPLTNPARVRHQLVGVSDPAMAPVMAGVFGATGSRRSLIVHADDGLDELSVTSPTSILDVRGDGSGAFEVTDWRVDPVALGLQPAKMADLRGGDAAFNAQVIRRVLEGERGARRDIGVLNAAAALLVAGRADDLAGGLELAAASLDSGRALGVLDALVATSQDALRREQD